METGPATSDLLVTLLSGTFITSLIGAVYTIWRERKGNAQKDAAGDVTLGQLFRDIATKAVRDANAEAEDCRQQLHDVRAKCDRQETELRACRQESRNLAMRVAALEASQGK